MCRAKVNVLMELFEGSGPNVAVGDE